MPSKGQSIVLPYRAWNTTAQAYQSGDSGNHNLCLLKDATEATPTNAAAEVDGTNAPGLYYVALTSAETLFNTVTIQGKSSTASVLIIGTTIGFEQLPVPAAAAAGGLLTFGSGAGQISTNVGGVVDANVDQWTAVAVQTNAGLPLVTTALSGSPVGTVAANLVSVSGNPVQITSTGLLSVNVGQYNSQTVATHISGIPDVNVLYWDQQPALVDSNNLPKVDMEDIIGSSVSTQVAADIVAVVAASSGGSASPNLATYLTDVQNLLGVGGTSTANLYTTAQLTNYINKARMQIAAEGQCVRVLTPISNGILSITVNSGGAGYTNPPTVQITAPDSPSGSGVNFSGVQATAVAGISGSNVVSVTVLSGGAGYFQPVVTLISGGGFGATATALVSPVARTVVNQEVYPFSQFNSLIAAPGSGVSNILQVHSISTIWGTFRYTLIHKSFSAYQSYARTYTAGYQYIPTVWAQYGQGTAGSFYLYPIPNDAYQLELDCFCLPAQLNTSADPEAIPAQWSDAVPFLAAYYAYLGSQRMADAQEMWKQFQVYMKRARQQSQSGGIVNPYGRA